MALSTTSGSETGRVANIRVNETATNPTKEPSLNNGNTKSTDTHNDAGATGKTNKNKSKIAELWGKVDIDVGTALMMMKAALPPTIALAMYEADAVAEEYTTLGYLTAIISILGFCIMPRAKFIQTMVINVFSTCLGAAMCALMLWSAVQARLHTTHAGATPEAYNSSQSVVCAIWLFFQTWLVNTLKARYPQLAFPTIMYSILVNVAASSGPQFRSSVQVLAFVRRLLVVFLTGFAITTGVSLFILPVTCRKVVTKEITGFVTLLRGTLQAHKNYYQSLETTDMFDQTASLNADDMSKSKEPVKKPEIEALKSMTAAITALHGKLHGDLPFAKREIAWGKLTPEDFEGIFKHLRAIMVPLTGLGSIVDIFDRYAELNHWDAAASENADAETRRLRQQSVRDWNEIMTSVHDPFGTIIDTMDGGLQHILLRLQLIETPRKKKSTDETDPEAKGDMVQPGDKNFADYLAKQSDAFSEGKESTLEHWIESKGIKLREGFFTDLDQKGDPLLHSELEELEKSAHWSLQRNRRQLYLVLYIIFLLHSVSRAVLDLVRFADERDQANAKSRLINPGKKRLAKWAASIFKAHDSNHDDETTVVGDNIVYMGEAYTNKKEPDHLPPVNAWEKFGNVIRGISGFMRSPDSAFGFRTACATMSIAVIVYLHDSQAFFYRQRLVWAMIMVALSMVPTSGQTIHSFTFRIFGTLIAMCIAFLCWYIPDQKTAGIIVFLWFFLACGFYFPLKRPDLIMPALISIVTATMIIGYELSVRKIGREVATASGQPYYPIYLLAPYRLATVVGGLSVAFFWSVFPYPVSEHSALRQKLGGALYLSANFYSIMHETVMARIRGDEGDPDDVKSPSSQLTKARNKVFAKQMLTLQGLKMHADMVKWEFPLGGKFPRREYETILQCVSNITNYTVLIIYASNSFTNPRLHDEDNNSSAQWFRDFKKVMKSADITSHEITSLLALISSSITSGQPLPPYLVAPQSFKLPMRMDAVDGDILSVQHIAEPGYAAFAVMHISTRCIHMDMEKLLSAVKRLVGELDFSFHTVSTQDSSRATSTDTLSKSLSGRSKQD